MDTRTTGYLAKKHASLKEQAFQSRSQFNEDYKTPALLANTRPRTRSTNATDKHVDMIRHPSSSHYSTEHRYSDSRYSDGVRYADSRGISSSASDIHRTPPTDHLSNIHHRMQANTDYRNSADPALRVPIPGRKPSMCPASEPVIPRARSKTGYRPRPRSIATDTGYMAVNSKHYTDLPGPISPEYRSSTSNLLHSSSQAGTRPGESDVRKWGSCSRLEYNGQAPSSYGHYPVPGHERTEGDGGPSSYPEPAYNPYRRHSASKLSSHSGNSDDVILAQKAELDEKNRVIESLKMRVAEVDPRSLQPERAYSDKSGEHGAAAESLDSGIDIRSETGHVMKPQFPGSHRSSNEERNELARQRLYIKQLEARIDGGDSDKDKQDGLLKEISKLTEEKAAVHRQFTRLQDYLTTLPTSNEFTELKDKLASKEDENKVLHEERKRSGDSSKEVKQKDVELKKYQKKCNELKLETAKLEKQNNLLKSQNANQSKQEVQRAQTEKGKLEKQVEQLRKDCATLSGQKESTKNLVGGYYEKFNNEQEKNKILADSLDKAVTEKAELKSSLDIKNTEFSVLQAKVEDLEQELEVAHISIEALESRNSNAAEDTEALMNEFNAAFNELNSMVEVCQMFLAGQNPDISLLLGLGSSPRPSNPGELSIDQQLINIKTVRSNIEFLRDQISESYATDVGSRCLTQ